MTVDEIKTLFKEYLSSDPLDIYRDDGDLRVSNIELVDERLVNDNLSRQIGSANLFIASAFLSTINHIELPAKSKNDIKKSQLLWEEMVEELKKEGFIREKPSSVRERFTVV